jgi:hypothetical protein
MCDFTPYTQLKNVGVVSTQHSLVGRGLDTHGLKYYDNFLLTLNICALSPHTSLTIKSGYFHEQL